MASYNLSGITKIVESLTQFRESMSAEERRVFFNIEHLLYLLHITAAPAAINLLLPAMPEYRKVLTLDLSTLMQKNWPRQSEVLQATLKYIRPKILDAINTAEDVEVIENLIVLFLGKGVDLSSILLTEAEDIFIHHLNLLDVLQAAFSITETSVFKMLETLCSNPLVLLQKPFLAKLVIAYIRSINNTTLFNILCENTFEVFVSPRQMLDFLAYYPDKYKRKLEQLIVQVVKERITDLTVLDVNNILDVLSVVKTIPNAPLTNYYELGLAFKKGNIPSHPVSNICTVQRALACFKIPALMGEAKAQHNAGMMELHLAQNKRATPLERAEHLANSRMWFTKAAGQGIEEAKRNLERMQNQSVTPPVATEPRSRQLQFTFVGDPSVVDQVMRHRAAIERELTRRMLDSLNQGTQPQADAGNAPGYSNRPTR